MPYCPRCFTEYVEGSVECEDCRVPLQPGPPPEHVPSPREVEMSPDVKLVRIRTFSGPTALLDADVARNILRSQGIPCLLPGEISAELLPVLDVPLLVRKEDAARAEKTLKSYLDSPGSIPGE